MHLPRTLILFALFPALLSVAAPAVQARPNADPALYVLLPLQTLGSASGWHGYSYRMADVDGDGKDDIIWNNLCQKPVGPGGCVTSANYVAGGLSRGDGTFRFSSPNQIGSSGWDTYRWFVGDVGGDGKADLLWNSLYGGANYVYVGVSHGDGTFTLGSLQIVSAGGFNNFNTNAGDFNGDGRLDLYWGTVCSFANQINSCSVGDTNHLRVGLGTSSNTFLIEAQQDLPYTGWSDFMT